ncbi:hypothetical protein DYB32_004152 [Aphanomyces invadans]|uniref:ATP-grasp domain-containing protein n=1 Tax=Aphanomyces invadans TaxID=157072 RepID=A0A3R6ZRF8_9STRA|nr:hypothetical protein DYB32_004152 [Aphanomyces invadans]
MFSTNKTAGKSGRQQQCHTKARSMDWYLDEQSTALQYYAATPGQRTFKVRVDAMCDYVRPLVLKAFIQRSKTWDIVAVDGDPRTPDLLWQEYEDLNWKEILRGQVVANSYCVRKGLSRKAQLSIFLSKYIRKNPACVLSKALPQTLVVDLWDAFDQSLADLGISFRNRLESCLWEVKQVFDPENADTYVAGGRWIMKPSATNKVRVYVVAVGALEVYVYQNVLLLTSLNAYDPANVDDKLSHITNTYQQQDHPNFVEADCVLLLEDMEAILQEDRGLSPAQAKRVTTTMLADIGAITKDVFAAYRGEFSVFQPLPNCFEVYGVDFIVDEDLRVWLLEVNPGPDFKQTGNRLQPLIQTLFEGMVDIVTDTFFVKPATQRVYPAFEKVYSDNWGTSATMTFRDD